MSVVETDRETKHRTRTRTGSIPALRALCSALVPSFPRGTQSVAWWLELSGDRPRSPVALGECFLSRQPRAPLGASEASALGLLRALKRVEQRLRRHESVLRCTDTHVIMSEWDVVITAGGEDDMVSLVGKL